jgi:hypothetical protein
MVHRIGQAGQNDIVKAWVLYRMGIAQQRLGQFPAADKTFTAVSAGIPLHRTRPPR